MRLIDADAFKSKLKKQDARTFAIEELNLLIDFAPIIDAVPVVRCKDCEHWDVSKNEYSICCHAYHNMMMVRSDGMGFCSDGERKDK